MTRKERKEYDRVKKAEFRAKMIHKKKEEFEKDKRNIESKALQRKNSF